MDDGEKRNGNEEKDEHNYQSRLGITSTVQEIKEARGLDYPILSRKQQDI